MPLIMNATHEAQTIVAFGNHFKLAAGQIKMFNENISHFIATERRHQGVVALPEQFEDVEFRSSAEGQRLLAEYRQQGILARINHLKSIIYNNQVSLRQDLEKANIKADPRVFASEGEIAAMEELVSYQTRQEDETAKKVDRIKELEKQIGKLTK